MSKRLLLTPLKPELQALTAGFKDLGLETHLKEIGRLKFLEIPELDLICTTGGHGKAQFALQTQFAIHQLQPARQNGESATLNAVICAGAGGALTDQTKLGDVIIAEKTIEHDFDLKFVQRPKPEFSADENLIALFRSVSKNSPESPVSSYDFNIHFGTIASGDEDILDAERAKELHLQTKAIAVAWEGAGGARAAKHNSLPFIEIRGLTDSANHRAQQDFAVHLQTAMKNIATVLARIF